MNEESIVKWLSANWPSVSAGIIASAVYLRVWSFVARLERIEKRMRRVMHACVSKHPEHGADLFDDEHKEG